MTKFYQACFSRLGGNDIASGWQTLNISEGMPRQLKELFERAARADQPADYDTPKDQNGNALCMLEFIGDGSNVGVSRVQYGLNDNFGRENMFCHGFLFPNAYALLKDPNQILGICDSNFRFTPEETAAIPESLAMQEPFSVAKALEICRMDTEGYVRLVSCVYYALATNAKTTIYVRTDGSDRMARALLYLIYSAIPYSLRTKVTAATYANPHAQNTMLVMCPELPESGMYVDPVSGENNILTSNLQNRWKRYPFVEFFARNHEQLGENKERLFQEFENWLTRMGDTYLNNMDALRLAFSMMQKDSNPDVAGLLYDWLVLPVPNNETLEQCVCDLLGQVIAQDISLGSDTEKILAQRLAAASSKELIKLGHQYHAAQLIKMPADAATAFIDELSPESPLFNAIRANLAASDNGRSVLCNYYLFKAKPIVENSELTYDELEDFIRTFSDLSGMNAVWREVLGKTLSMAKEEIAAGGAFVQVANALQRFLKENYPNLTEELWEKCVARLAFTYDQRFRMHFNPDKLEEYQQFYNKIYADNEHFAHSADLLKKYRAIQIRDYATAAQYVADGCVYQGVAPSAEDEQKVIVQSLLRFAFACGAAENCMDMRFWTGMAKALGIPEVQLMVQKQARLFCDPDTLNASMENDPYWTVDSLQALYDSYKDYVENNPEAAVYKRSADILNKEIRSRMDEAKKQERERKRQERNEARAEQRQERSEARSEQKKTNLWDNTVNGGKEETSPWRKGYDPADERNSRRDERAEDKKRKPEAKPQEKEGIFSKLFGGGNRWKK